MAIIEENAGAQATTENAGAQTQTQQTQTQNTWYTGWKSSLRPDLKGSPLLAKFHDTPEGLNDAFTSHNNLESLLGRDKVIVPKDAKDEAGWSAFAKAMGIPDKADGYGLSDAKLPESMVKQGVTLDKNQFAEVMHAHKVHPSAVKGIWDVYQQMTVDAYNKAVQAHQQKLTQSVNQLKGEWGESFDTNVELGQAVINKFSADKESNDYITATLSSDPRGIKFLAKIGEQFAENKIPEFQMKKFSMAPAEAQAELAKMRSDKSHPLNGPYFNLEGKFTNAEHQAAVDRVNALIAKAQSGG